MLRTVEYNNTAAPPTPTNRTVNFKVNDGDTDSSIRTSTITVVPLNVPPVVDLDSTTDGSDSTASFTEDAGPAKLAPNATVTDSDDTNLVSAEIKITNLLDGADESLAVDVGTTGIDADYDPDSGTLALTGAATVAQYEQVLKTATYNNSSNTPHTTDREVEFTVNDGQDDSEVATSTVSVAAADDPPVAVDDSDLDPVAEDSDATTIDVLANDTDVDGGPKEIASATQPANGTVVVAGDNLSLSYEPDADYCNDGSPTDDFTYTLNGGSTATVAVSVTCVDDDPVAVDDSATVLEDAAATSVPVLDNDTDIDCGPKTITEVTQPTNGTVVITGGGSGLTYQPAPNYCNDPPGTTPDTFTYTLNGGSEGTVSMTVTCVNDAPLADDETFNGDNGAIGNTTLVVNDPDDGAPSVNGPKKSITGDILTGDTDVDGPGPLTITPGTFATNDGGSVTIESDGDFTFTPAAGTSCTDTSDFFDYTVEDSGSPEQTDTGRVTISIAGCVWYVSNNASGNSGTSSAPFDTLAQAETASGNNHTVFVFDGDNTSTGYGGDGYQMNAGERLIGEHEGLVVDPDQGGVLLSQTLHPANAGAHPTLTATNADVIDLDDGNEVRGLQLDPQGTGGGIGGGSGDTGGATIDDVNIVDIVDIAVPGSAGTQPGLELDSTTGTFNISNLVVNNRATGVRLHNTTTPANAVNAVFAPASQISITSNGGPGLDVDGTAAVPVNLGTSTFDDITVTNSGTGGVNITNASGTINLGDGDTSDLSLTTTSGATPAFELNNAGNITVAGAGTDNVSTTGGPAINVSNMSGTTLDFDTMSSNGSSTDGVRLDNTSGTVTGSAGTIQNAGDQDIDISGNNSGDTVDFTYNGSITDDVGALVNVSGQNGGTKDFNGAITDGNDGDGAGISLTNNTGATVRFDGGLTLATGTSNAFGATGGGTVVVTDPAGATDNTLATTTGTALNVANTTIGASGLTFRSISSNGGTSNGITLDTTGSSGGLTVTGDGTNTSVGGNSTGGTISNKSGADGNTTQGIGIFLRNTSNVVLRRMTINGTNQNYGIFGLGVNNFTLEYSTVGGTNGTAASLPAPNNAGEGSIYFGQNELSGGQNGLTGSATVTNVNVSGGRARNFSVINTSGTLNRITITGSTFGLTQNFSDGNQALAMEARQSGTVLNATVTGSTFTGSPGDAANFTGQQGTTMDVIFGGVTATPGTAPGNVITNSHTQNIIGGGNLNLSTAGTMTYNVRGNTMRDADGSAVTLFKASPTTGTPSMSGVFSNNTIGVAGVRDSGSKSGNGIFVSAGGTGTMSYTIANNQIHQIDGNAHIFADNTGGSYTANFTITGNLLTGAQPPNWFAGIAITNGSPTSADTVNVCAKIGGSSAAEKNTLNLNNQLGIIVGSSGAASGHTFNLPGLATFTEAGVESFIQGNNAGSFTTDAFADAPATFAAFTGTGTSCPTP